MRTAAYVKHSSSHSSTAAAAKQPQPTHHPPSLLLACLLHRSRTKAGRFAPRRHRTLCRRLRLYRRRYRRRIRHHPLRWATFGWSSTARSIAMSSTERMTRGSASPMGRALTAIMRRARSVRRGRCMRRPSTFTPSDTLTTSRLIRRDGRAITARQTSSWRRVTL